MDLDPPRDMLPTTPAEQPERVLESLATKLIPAMTPEFVPYSGVSIPATDMLEYCGETYRTVGAEDLDGKELGLLGYTVGLGSNGTSAVSAVAVAISVGTIASVVGEEGSTTLELRVRGGDTSIDDVHAGARSSRGVVGVGSGSRVGVGDAAETPGSRRLGGVRLLLESVLDLTEVGLDDCVLLDVVDTRKVLEDLDDVVAHLSGETTKVTELVDMGRVLLENLQSSLEEVLEVLVLQLDDVLSRDGSTSARLKNRSRESSSQSWQERKEESELHDGGC